jgi:hypothetical protein
MTIASGPLPNAGANHSLVAPFVDRRQKPAGQIVRRRLGDERIVTEHRSPASISGSPLAAAAINAAMRAVSSFGL